MKRSVSPRAAALTATLLALGILAGCASRDAATTSASPRAASQPNAILVNCQGQPQTRPASFVLTCADANDVLTGLRWVSWDVAQAFGTGTEKINTCTPDCADGKFVSYPVLITLWRPEPRPGHPGAHYFTRITRIYPADRPPLYNCQGSHPCYPLTSTFNLWSNAINA